LREETATIKHAGMQIGPEQGQFMALLVQMLGARNTIEVGVFTGYSSLAVALALPEDGRVVACDLNEEWTAIGAVYWEKPASRTRSTCGSRAARRTLEQLLREGGAGRYDFASSTPTSPTTPSTTSSACSSCARAA
jgi:caffeoyl-CoA O-methyltransferase